MRGAAVQRKPRRHTLPAHPMPCASPRLCKVHLQWLACIDKRVLCRCVDLPVVGRQCQGSGKSNLLYDACAGLAQVRFAGATHLATVGASPASLQELRCHQRLLAGSAAADPRVAAAASPTRRTLCRFMPHTQVYYEAVDQLGADSFARDQADQEEHVQQCQEGAAAP